MDETDEISLSHLRLLGGVGLTKDVQELVVLSSDEKPILICDILSFFVLLLCLKWTV